MVKLNKIYTRTGDKGTSGLVDGTRRSKADKRFAACGTIDEANSIIGLAIFAYQANTRNKADESGKGGENFSNILTHIQNDLFDLGADLATLFKQTEQEGDSLRIIASQVTWLEEKIDEMNVDLLPLKSFILPGGDVTACYLHMARTIVRRAEREMVALSAVEEVNSLALCYVNRLSDLLFVAARCANNNGADDVLWVPGKNR